MKRYHTTIKTVDELKASIDNSRAAGIFKNGETFEDFAENVAAYIDYCEAFGCQVVEKARPDRETLKGWIAPQRHVSPAGMTTVRYEHPDGTPDWCKCDEGSLKSFMQYLDTHGCRFIAKEAPAA